MYYKITTTTIAYILSAIIFSGCSPLVHTQSPQLIMPTNNDLGKPEITEIYIDISCEDVQIDNEIRMIQGISENDMIALTIEL
jgi:hypothetical protein